ncbi:hypothetical protein [Streptomyces halstedii]|uniref:Threonine dehydratase n=1 Tax=Streptomyces halstedii TaxID=1944 RepID=A0A6N9U211_STRHA|nr:hypothetical protein [Streptomyces halstedii]NEA17668.1 hypothetical protein [Streptomyces halstedii]
MSTPPAHHPLSSHTHQHGPECGHVAIPHHDHTDYVHDSGLHRMHGDHADACANPTHTVHEQHDHQHGTDCGHVAVPHDDHMDYVHDGHRHAAHDGHWDDH